MAPLTTADPGLYPAGSRPAPTSIPAVTTGGAILGGGTGTNSNPYTTASQPTPSTPPMKEGMVNGQMTLLTPGSNNTTLPTSPNSNPTTYPVVTSSAATNDVNNMQNTANTLSGQVAGQVQTNAQNTANTAQGASGMSGAANNSTQGQSGQGDTVGTVGTGAQGQSPSGSTNDNSDLTSALNAATSAITPPDQNAYKQEESQLTSQGNDIQNKLNDVSNQTTDAYNQFQSMTNQMLNGTFPLSPTQQGQVQQMQSSYNSLIQATQQANQNYLNGVKSFGITTGLDMYSPVLALQAINQATQDANAKVASVEVEATKALSDLQNSFQTQDFNMMSKSYDALNNALDKKASTLTSLLDNVQKQAQQATTDYNEQVKDYQTQVQNAFTDAWRSQQLSDTEKNDAFNQYISQAKLTDTEKQDAVDDYYKGITASQEQTKIDQGQQNINIKLQALQDSKDADSLAAAGAARTTMGGNTYIDGSDLTPAAITKAVENGQVVLPKTLAPSMTQVNNVQQQYGNLLTSLQQGGLVDKSGKVIPLPTGIRTVFTHGSQGQDAVTAFNTSIKSMVSDLQKLPGTGELVDALNSNTFNASALDGENSQTLQTKLTNIYNAMNDTENSLLTQGIKPAPSGQTLLFDDNDSPVYVPNDNVAAFIKAGGHQ